MKQKNEIVGILIALLFVSIYILSFIYDIVILQPVFSFLTGASITYVVQHWLQIGAEKRKEKREDKILMRDTIYGPIFMGISKTIENLISGKRTDKGNLETIREHYLYFTLRQDLKDTLSELLDRVSKYETIKWLTDRMFNERIRKETLRIFSIDIGDNGGDYTGLSMRVGGAMVSHIGLKMALFGNVVPKEFVVTEKQKWGDDTTVEVYFGERQKSNNLNDFELLFENVLREVEKEPLYGKEKEQRNRLVQEFEAFLAKIRIFVTTEKA